MKNIQDIITDMREQAWRMREATKNQNGSWSMTGENINYRTLSYQIDTWANSLAAELQALGSQEVL